MEDLTAALGAEDVVSETEVFVEYEAAFWDPLVTVLALYIIWIWRNFRDFS